jgi:diguanylate cyclase (GGDEF)-like protein
VKIILIDDDEELLELVEEFLSFNGIEVTACTSGKEGLTMIEKETFDLAVLDVMMPGMSGLDVLKKINSDFSYLPVIMLTAKGEEIDRVVGIELGADDYMVKPFSSKELLARIKAIGRRKEKTLKERETNIDHAELALLYEVSQAVNQRDDLDEILVIILDAILKGVNSQKGSIMLIDEKSNSLVLRVFRNKYITDKSNKKIFNMGEGIGGRVAQTGKALIANDGHRNPLFLLREGKDYNTRNLMCVPMIINNRVTGIVNVSNKNDLTDYNEGDLGLVTALVSQMSVIVDKARLHDLATIDGLTGLYMHRYFQKRLDEEILCSKRYGHEFTLVMFDIDYFKKVNDTYGHQQGDMVLIDIAGLVKENIRVNVDIPARYGGEEFAVILPEQTWQKGKIFAERLRKVIENHKFPGPTESLHVTISAGIGSYPQDGEVKNMLINMTDRALYFAKNNGRNQVWSVREMLDM